MEKLVAFWSLTGELVASAPQKFDTKIELVEPMGSDTLAYTTLGQNTLRVRMDGQARVAVGDTLAIGIDTSRASLFDTATEDRL